MSSPDYNVQCEIDIHFEINIYKILNITFNTVINCITIFKNYLKMTPKVI